MTTKNGGETANPTQPQAPAPAPAPAQPQAKGPTMNVLAQYIKDFSFENPNAPRTLGQQPQSPTISININVNPKQLTNTDFEVELKLEGKAEVSGTTLFGFDLVYGGVFRLQNVPQENLGPLVMIECPRLLFPFAREIVAKAVTGGGYPPLMLDPVDFVGLYQQKIATVQAQPAQPPKA
jgi:preprotein translocase subunit SecB